LKIDADGNMVPGFNNGQTYFGLPNGSYFKAYNEKVYYITGSYNSLYSDVNLIGINPETGVMETSVNVYWDANDFFVDQDENITVLSTGAHNYSVPHNQNVDVRKYSRESENMPYNVQWGYNFNLTDINGFNTDDSPGNMHIYNGKMLITGNSQIPQDGIDGMKFTMRRFNFNPLSNDEFGRKNVSVYPNPITNVVNLNFSAMDFPLTVDIFNTAGQLVSHQLLKDNPVHISIDMSSLPSGIYYMTTKDSNTVSQTNKLIKQ